MESGTPTPERPNGYEPEALDEAGLPKVSSRWWIGATVVVAASVLLIVGVIIPVLGGGWPFGKHMEHKDDPPSVVQSDGTVFVETAEARRQPIEQLVTYTGTVIPLYEEEVRPRVEGWLKSITVDDGDRVTAGQVVAELDDVELTARAEAAKAGWTSASEGASGAREAADAARAEQTANEAKLEGAQAGITEAEAMVTEADREVEMAQAEYDAQSGGLREAESMLAGAQAMLQQEQAMVSGKEAALDGARSGLNAALAEQSMSQSKLEAARTKRDQALARKQAAEAMTGEQEADVRSAEADLTYKEGVYRRDTDLHNKGAISTEELEASRREVEMARGMRDAAAAKTTATRADVAEADAMIAEADAMEREAESGVTGAGAEVSRMKADIRMADAEVEAAQNRVEQASAEVKAAQAKVSMAEADLRGETAAVDGAKARRDQTQAKADMARAMAREYEAMVDRARKMVLEAQAMSRQAASEANGMYQEYLAESRVADYATVRAQTSGTVTSRKVDPGSLVDPGMTLVTIGAYNAVRIQVKVADEHVRRLTPGAVAYVRLGDDPADVIRAEVATVFPNQEPETRTGLVEIVLDNAKAGLKKDAYVKVDLVLDHRDEAVVVPSAAIATRDGVPVAFVVEDGVAHAREVTVGIDNGTMCEIVTGVDAGETVVSTGVTILVDGQMVSTTPGGSGAPAEAMSGDHDMGSM